MKLALPLNKLRFDWKVCDKALIENDFWEGNICKQTSLMNKFKFCPARHTSISSGLSLNIPYLNSWPWLLFSIYVIRHLIKCPTVVSLENVLHKFAITITVTHRKDLHCSYPLTSPTVSLKLQQSDWFPTLWTKSEQSVGKTPTKKLSAIVYYQ